MVSLETIISIVILVVIILLVLNMLNSGNRTQSKTAPSPSILDWLFSPTMMLNVIVGIIAVLLGIWLWRSARGGGGGEIGGVC